MRTEETSAIRELALFRDMQEASFEALIQAAYLQQFPPHLQLVAEGDPADFLHVVVEGGVELFAMANGRETTMSIVRPVATFILAAALKDAVYLMSARTLEKSRVLLIPASDLRAVFRRDAAFALSIADELGSAYRLVIKALKNQKLRTGLERLANHLIQLDRNQAGGGVVRLETDKKTIAALLGMTPENLSRAFASLVPYGVEVDGRDVRITDPVALRTLAKPNPLIDDPTS